MSFRFGAAEPSSKELPYEPRLSFSDAAWRKLVLYTSRCELEIGGLGLLEEQGRDFVVRDVLVVEQDINDIATRLRSSAVADLMVGMVRAGQDPAVLKVWWHSHAKEGVFWSGEDEETIERFRNDFMVSVVTNHRMQILARVDHYQPRTTRWVHVDRPAGELRPTPAECEAVDAEITAKTRHVPRRSSRIF